MDLPKIDFGGSTALVTGGTSGIGRAIAHELVTRGVRRLVLVAKKEDKLAETAADFQRTAPDLEVQTIVADLTAREAPGDIQRQIEARGWTVDLLVNNAGFGRKYIFAKDIETDTSLDTVDLMVRAVVELSLRFLPGMVERRRGGILNVSSTACYQPVPYTAMYGAAKAFVTSFSQAIREENRDTGVRVACIVPGVTETNLDGKGHGERRGPLDMVGIDQPEDVAKIAVDALEENAPARIVGLNNKLLRAGFGILPDSVNARLIAAVRGAPGEE